jgi:hypothetical protein
MTILARGTLRGPLRGPARFLAGRLPAAPPGRAADTRLEDAMGDLRLGLVTALAGWLATLGPFLA